MGVRYLERLPGALLSWADEWAERWIEIGVRTGPSDPERFESAMRRCYEHAGVPWPGAVVWVPSPRALAVEAPALEAALGIDPAGRHWLPEAISHQCVVSVAHAASLAMDPAVGDEIRYTAGLTVDGAVDHALGDVVERAIADEHRAAPDVVATLLTGEYLTVPGQFWVGGYLLHNLFWQSFFRDVCELELDDGLWPRSRAYEAAVESACCWWPHRDFVMVCERPLEIHREVDPARWRTWRLHREDGPAMVWPDGWGIWAIHGVRVPRQVIEAPHALRVEQILDEPDRDVRGVMLDRYGIARFMRDAAAVLADDDGEWGKLWRVERRDGREPLVMVEVINSTPEPDGSSRTYWLRVPPDMPSARAAIAWTFAMPGDDYDPAVQT